MKVQEKTIINVASLLPAFSEFDIPLVSFEEEDEYEHELIVPNELTPLKICNMNHRLDSLFPNGTNELVSLWKPWKRLPTKSKTDNHFANLDSSRQNVTNSNESPSYPNASVLPGFVHRQVFYNNQFENPNICTSNQCFVPNIPATSRNLNELSFGSSCSQISMTNIENL